MHAILAALVFGVSLGPPSGAQADGAPPPQTVVMISLDGTRPSDVTPDTMPRLAALARRGVVAEAMVGVIPTNTFPSHVSLVTGVAPDRHGVVNNVFEDAERGVFDKRDIPTWVRVEPIWSQLERAGVRTASYHWVASEGAWPGGLAASDWVPFDSRTPERKKVDRILEWLDRPGAERPRLITSWFHGADHAAHDHGPGSAEVARSLRTQDEQIGRLIDAVEARDDAGAITFLFVSDHGMTTADRRVDLGSALRKDGIDARVYGIGGFATVVLSGDGAGDPAAMQRVVTRAEALGLEAAVRSRAPAAWRVDDPRFDDVVVRAPIGTAIVHRGLRLTGFHGYAPEADDMAALFIVWRPGREAGVRIPVVRTVDVAPTVLTMLDQPVPEWMEGRPITAITTSEATPPPPGSSRANAGDGATPSATARSPGAEVRP